MSISDLFREAAEHHQAGRLSAAEARYQQILRTRPDHADSLHLLGVIAHQRGENERAIDLIRRAIVLNGTDAAYHSNLAVALRALKRPGEALAQLQEAVRLNADYAPAHKNLGVTLNHLGRPREAIPYLRRALALRPGDATACKALGVSLLRCGRLDESARLFAKAVDLKPDDADALNNLGVVLKDLGRLDEAAAHLRQAVQRRPQFAEAHSNLGIVLSLQGRLEASVARFQEALRIDPDCLDARHNLGVVLRDLGRVEEGIALIRQVLEVSPGDVEALNNLGVALQTLGDYDGAMAHYERALRIRPDHVWGRFNRSTLLLATGNFEQGWLEYEWRWKRPGLAPRRFGRPLWDGSPAPRQTVLVYSEQGLGDTLQFVRYAAPAKQRVGRLILQCQDILLPILSRCRGIDQFVAKGGALPEFDVHAPLMSLPGIFGTPFTPLPADVPYVFPDPALVEQWRARLTEFEGFKVGINWQGNPQFRRDHHRSMPLACLAPLAEVPGVRLVSLQWGPGREQLTDGSVDFPVVDFGDELDRTTGAFMDRAAIMMNLDLVVTSDTATPHLAGALAVPVWVALSVSPDWRWFREGEACPWYPTMRLFRQPRLGDWDTVFRSIAERLHETVRAGADPRTAP